MNKFGISPIVLMIVIISTFVISMKCKSQSINNVDFYMKDKNIIINYDIMEVKPGDTFKVWIDVRAEKGPINASALSGDIGEDVSGGMGKQIIWDIKADNFYGSENMEIEVFAIPMQGKLADTKPKEKHHIVTGKALVRSAILPGLGNSYVKNGGPYWLLGIAGYGAIAGSVIMNNSASKSLERYREANTRNERNKFFEDATTQDDLSNTLAGIAAIIWVGDLVWTGLQASAKSHRYNSKLALFIDYEQDQLSYHPAITLRYKF